MMRGKDFFLTIRLYFWLVYRLVALATDWQLNKPPTRINFIKCCILALVPSGVEPLSAV